MKWVVELRNEARETLADCGDEVRGAAGDT